jgi:5-formyltetrahydrofolate cyclo-ligase
MVQHSKKEMRRELRVVLANLDKRWENVAQSSVCTNLLSLVATLDQEAPVTDVFGWVPCFPGEVDLAAFIAEMLKARRVYLPRVRGTGAMDFIRISGDWASGLERLPSGLVQPRDDYGEVVRFENVGRCLALVPGMAFDGKGRRLGRGGGYYDRFLAGETMQRAEKVGVCFSVQIVSEVPVDKHDVVMNWVCHERGVFET